MSYQVLNVQGAIDITTEFNASTDRGEILFTQVSGDSKITNGKLKCVGYAGFGNFLFDCAPQSGGIVFRTSYNQDDGLGKQGPFAPYSFQVVNSNGLAGSGCITPSMYVRNTDPLYGGAEGLTIFQASRASTANMTASRLESVIGAMTQQQFRLGEAILFNMGFNSYYGGCGGLGYYSDTGSSSSAGNRLFLGMYQSSTNNTPHALAITPSNEVEILSKLTVDTIEAQTYLNYPTTDLNPLTLDQTNNRVGINNATPTVDLDVTGNILATDIEVETAVVTTDLTVGNIVAATGSLEITDLPGTGTFLGIDSNNAVSRVTVPVESVAPLTLDNVNARVGVNQVSPTYTLEATQTDSNSTKSLPALSVTGGGLKASRTSSAAYTNLVEGYNTDTSSMTFLTTGYNSGRCSFLGFNNTYGILGVCPSEGTYNTNLFAYNNSTTQFAGNVGINTTPTANALAIAGATYGSSDITTATKLRYGGAIGTGMELIRTTASPEGVITAPVGSIAMNANGGKNTTMYLKQTGSGNTGWTVIQPQASRFTFHLNPNYTNAAITSATNFIDFMSFSLAAYGIFRVSGTLQITKDMSAGAVGFRLQTSNGGSIVNTLSASNFYGNSVANSYPNLYFASNTAGTYHGILNDYVVSTTNAMTVYVGCITGSTVAAGVFTLGVGDVKIYVEQLA